MAKMIETMEKQGVIQPSACPGQTLWFWFRRKTEVYFVSKKDVYQLPQVDDILDALGDAKYFSTLKSPVSIEC